jgi:DNA-binding NarL/FixJ family response regulator
MISVAPTPSVPRPECAPSPATRMRLLVVDDHPAMRTGLRDLLTDEVDFDVVAVAATAEDALAVAARGPIDLAIVDYHLGGRNGLWLSRKLKRLGEPPAVLIYSAYTDGLLAAAAVVAEADAIVSKATLGFELCEAIRRVAGGRRHIPLLPQAVAEGVRRRLDDQEKAIFGMLLAGIAPAEVAATLGLSAADLESTLWSMLRRLDGPPGARTR